jgi:O-antigen/teichoic acid export membrane protein
MSDLPPAADPNAAVTDTAEGSRGRGHFLLDVVTSYLASAAKVGSWAVITGLLLRYAGEAQLAVFALVRATLGVLNYAGVGMAPALVRMLSTASPLAELRKARVSATPAPRTNTLDYAGPGPRDEPPELAARRLLVSNGVALMLLITIALMPAILAYGHFFDRIHAVVGGNAVKQAEQCATAFGVAIMLRLVSDVFGADLQTRGLQWLDNLCLALAEAVWIAAAVAALPRGSAAQSLEKVAGFFLLASVVLLLMRAMMSMLTFPAGASRRPAPLRWVVQRNLLRTGSAITLGQLADFLYAPVAFILINELISPLAAAAYTPAVQIDAALLLLVGGLSTVLLPRSALAHAAGDVSGVRRYYVRGTLFSLAVLAAAAVVIALASKPILTLWLGQDMPLTRAILPLVLIHTVIGGASGVGRAVLLGMGKVRPFTISALAGGVGNVLLALLFVRVFGWGLHGIVAATITVVTLRCAVWMPWYVLHSLRKPL